jgi:hypothetical protein
VRPNGGLPAALNTGFAAARGEFLARLDADDLWHPLKLERQVEFARCNPEAAFIYTYFRYLDEQGRVFRDGPAQHFPRRALARGVWETILGTGSSVMMRRSAVEAVGGCEETPRNWEDLLLQLKISERYELGVVPEYLAGVRLRGGSLSKQRDVMLAGWLQLRKRIRVLFPQVPAQVHSWGHGARLLEMAEIAAWAHDYRGALKLLTGALRHDPHWTMVSLAHRTVRKMKKRFRRPHNTEEAPWFFDLSPSEPSNLRPYGAPAEGGALERLRHRREEFLVEIDSRRVGLSRDLRHEAAREKNQPEPDHSCTV